MDVLARSCANAAAIFVTTDARLRAAWCHVLGLDESHISNESNFFVAGGDSITATRLVIAARERGVSLDIETVFACPIFQDMAKLCRSTEPVTDIKLVSWSEVDDGSVQICAEACGVDRKLIEDIFPATDFQSSAFHQHMVFGTMISQIVFEVRGAFDLDLLRQVWQSLHEKNQILRTRLVKLKNRVLQVVVNDKIHWGSGCNLAKYKASNMSERIGSGDPLFRYAIVNEEDRVFVVWTCHHSGFDGWTRHLIMNELQEGLSNLTKFKSKPQGPTFKSFVEWQDSRSNKKSKAIAFWKQYLNKHPVLEGVRRPTPDYVPLTSSQLFKTIKVIKRANSTVRLSSIGYAAWAVTIGKLWNIDDILFASVKMGRRMAQENPLPNAKSIMGPMMVMNPVRIKFNKSISIGEFLHQVQTQLISAIEFEHEGWSIFKQSFNDAQGILPGLLNWHPLGSNPFSQTLKARGEDGKIGFLVPRQDHSTAFVINASMMVDIYEHESRLDVRVSYDEKIWEEKLVVELLDTFTDILTQMLVSKDRKLSDIAVSEDERLARLKSHL